MELIAKQFMSSKEVPITFARELRQNLDEGSTLELGYDLK